ncbi:MAG: DUF481 domain-containing protein [Halieaceae bacterium]|nr:DUF481 domain-containing protein [Halieaceae bacterium]
MRSAHYHRRSAWPLLSNLIGFACLVIGNTALADRLHLSDGESVGGTLVSVADGKVNWSNPILGELSVEQFHVRLIETEERYDLKTSSGVLENCWMYTERSRQHVHCDQGVQTLADWKLVVAAGEAVTEPPPLLTQRGDASFAFENISGNSDITRYDLNVRSEIRYIESRHTLALRYQEESADSQTNRNQWRTSYQYDQFLTEQWFATGNAFYEEDEFRELDQRSSVGAGMGYQFFETSFVDLSAKTTLNYLDEQFATGLERQNMAFLWNLDFIWRFNERGMELFHRHAFLHAFDSSDDYEVTTSTGFKYPINGSFSSVIQLDYDYDNLPAETAIDKTDQRWTIGINYDW